MHSLLVPHVIGQAKRCQKHPNRFLRSGFLEDGQIATGAFHVGIHDASIFPLEPGGRGYGGQGGGGFAIEEEG